MPESPSNSPSNERRSARPIRDHAAGRRARWAPSDRIEVTLLLRRGDSDSESPSMDDRGRVTIGHRAYRSREEFAALHGARSEDIELLRGFAKRAGLTVSKVHVFSV
jgi:hypothetical protein